MPPTPTLGFSALAISDRAGFPDLDAWLSLLGSAGVGGIGAVQIREKDLGDRALHDLARRARALLPAAVRVLVNGRLDVALAAGADGAHLPAAGLPAAALRARFPGALLGVSTHRLDEVEQAWRDGADYVTFGPVYPTPGKERYGPPAGIAALARAASIGIPVFALGGVTLDRLGEVASAGAAGVAAIRLFQPPSDVAAVLRAVRQRFAPQALESHRWNLKTSDPR
jgi:thiamine-phosphate pyrophosphorylase